MAACKYWEQEISQKKFKYPKKMSVKNEKTGLMEEREWRNMTPDDFCLTDEYFNVLSTYKDTIQNFFDESTGYQPLNPECVAAVFLVPKRPAKNSIHMLQLGSVEVVDDSKKDEG